jgi:hypothetical protein
VAPGGATQGGRLGVGTSSPWSIVDDWSVVALARPWSTCTITESWLAVASDTAPGDRMFALTAASIGAATLAFAATAASIGAARSRSRSRSAAMFSSDEPASRSPAESAGVSVALPTRSPPALVSPWLIAES